MNKWIIIILVFLYVIWPFDLIPDIIPLIGWIDDIALVIGAWYYLR